LSIIVVGQEDIYPAIAIANELKSATPMLEMVAMDIMTNGSEGLVKA